MSFCKPMTSSVRPPFSAAGCAKKTNPVPSRTKAMTTARSPDECKSLNPILVRSSPLEALARGKGKHAINRFFHLDKIGRFPDRSKATARQFLHRKEDRGGLQNHGFDWDTPRTAARTE